MVQHSKMLAVRITGQRVEVIPVEDDVDAGVLRPQDGVADLGVFGVLRLKLDADLDGVRSHANILPCRARRLFNRVSFVGQVRVGHLRVLR